MLSVSMANSTASTSLPPLPTYDLQPRPPLFLSIPDKYMSLILPLLAYWIVSMIFHYIDEYDLFPQYRLHTPAEVLKRNHVSRWEVIRDVVIQQIVQTIFGIGLAIIEEDQVTGKDNYNIAIWAQRVRVFQHHLPQILAYAGVDSVNLSRKIFDVAPSIAGALAGGKYPWLYASSPQVQSPAFAIWEIYTAKAIYWALIPTMQFVAAIIFVDTWQYFLHRAMHMNRWLYTTLHSRHHRLYVPYAYGALYNHPVEGFLLDTFGTGIAYLITGMTPRQAMLLFTVSTIKTVDDHCGYALPWDPLQHMTSNNAGYHDVHHQSWGIKTNFSQPYFTFWDTLLGTKWTGGDVSARYEKARIAADRKVAQDAATITDKKNTIPTITGSDATESTSSRSSAPYQHEVQDASHITPTLQNRLEPQIPSGKASAQALGSREQIISDSSDAGGFKILAEEVSEEVEAKKYVRKSPRKKSHRSTSASQAGSLKGLRDRLTTSGGAHGRAGSLIGYESTG